jgi:hypothetical protein
MSRAGRPFGTRVRLRVRRCTRRGKTVEMGRRKGMVGEEEKTGEREKSCASSACNFALDQPTRRPAGTGAGGARGVEIAVPAIVATASVPARQLVKWMPIILQYVRPPLPPRRKMSLCTQLVAMPHVKRSPGLQICSSASGAAKHSRTREPSGHQCPSCAQAASEAVRECKVRVEAGQRPTQEVRGWPFAWEGSPRRA